MGEPDELLNVRTIDPPKAWRGAAFQGGSSVGLQQAAPGSGPRLTIVPDVRLSSWGTIGARRRVDANTLDSSREPPAANT
jgi:hypothetical protein